MASAGVVEYKTVSAALFIGAVLVGLALAIRYRVRVIGAVRAFFSEPGTAFNLAVFRLVFYATALALAGVPLHTAEHFAALPRGLMVPPTGFSLVSSFFPISVTLVQIAFWVAVIASVFAAIGLFTRWASVVFLVAVTYYLTIPQIFGKVVHYHTIVWVAALLAVSRTSDVMSLDAVIRARRSRSERDRASIAERRIFPPDQADLALPRRQLPRTGVVEVPLGGARLGFRKQHAGDPLQQVVRARRLPPVRAGRQERRPADAWRAHDARLRARLHLPDLEPLHAAARRRHGPVLPRDEHRHSEHQVLLGDDSVRHVRRLGVALAVGAPPARTACLRLRRRLRPVQADDRGALRP